MGGSRPCASSLIQRLLPTLAWRFAALRRGAPRFASARYARSLARALTPARSCASPQRSGAATPCRCPSSRRPVPAPSPTSGSRRATARSTRPSMSSSTRARRTARRASTCARRRVSASASSARAASRSTRVSPPRRVSRLLLVLTSPLFTTSLTTLISFFHRDLGKRPRTPTQTHAASARSARSGGALADAPQAARSSGSRTSSTAS